MEWKCLNCGAIDKLSSFGYSELENFSIETTPFGESVVITCEKCDNALIFEEECDDEEEDECDDFGSR